jgi:hypothetical protein
MKDGYAFGVNFVGKTKKNQTKKRFFVLLFLNILVLYLAPGVELI